MLQIFVLCTPRKHPAARLFISKNAKLQHIHHNLQYLQKYMAVEFFLFLFFCILRSFLLEFFNQFPPVLVPVVSGTTFIKTKKIICCAQMRVISAQLFKCFPLGLSPREYIPLNRLQLFVFRPLTSMYNENLQYLHNHNGIKAHGSVNPGK